MFRYFAWGARHHPGNIIYLVVIAGIWVSALMDGITELGMIASVGGSLLVGGLYVWTSFSVGKANKRLVDDET